MLKTFLALNTAVAALTLACCANTHDPLEGYEQVQPAASLDSPGATDSSLPGQSKWNAAAI